MRPLRLGMALLVACYNPRAPEQVPCPTGVCPTGQTCVNAVCEPLGFQGDGGTQHDGPPDAAPDAPPDAPAGSACYGKGFITACFAMPPSGSLTLNGPVNTDTDSRCLPSSTATCQMAAGNISINSGVRVTGSRPLVLVSSGMITVAGLLDAASHMADKGAAANSSECSAGKLPLGPLGGVAGGSFTTAGGKGGVGADGAPPGMPGNTTVPSSLRGGCPGQNAGSGGTGTGAGAGAGGGAVYLIAAGTISVNGEIDASGAGGGPSVPDLEWTSGGGNGGGAGGMIGLDGTNVIVNGGALLRADGGGGGGGAGLMGGSGGPGMDPPPDSAAAGVGGAGGSPGVPAGNGGSGSTGAIAGAPGSNGLAGGPDGGAGGGGGGGEGAIEVWGVFVLMGTASPPATQH